MTTTLRLAAAVGLAMALVPAARADEPNPDGRPQAFAQGKAVMFAVWREGDEWVIRTTTNTKGGNKQFNARHEFVGKVRATGGGVTKLDLSSLDRARKLKDADFVTKVSNGFDFKFVNAGGIDGVKFRVDKRTTAVAFDVQIDRDDNANLILIGAAGRHPGSAKFSLPGPAAK